MSVDLSAMDVPALTKLIDDAGAELTRKKAVHGEEVRKQLAAAAEKEGFTIEELFGAGKAAKKAKRPATHCDPANPDNTWTGRGAKPKWLKEAEAAGKAADDFKI